MMAIIRAQVVIKHANAITADSMINNLSFSTADTLQQTLTEIFNATTDVYRGGQAGDRISDFWSDQVAQNGHEVKLYNMDLPKPRVPVFESPWNLSAPPIGDPLPSECAAVLSFQGVGISGSPQARRRGRIFIGGFTKTASNGARPSLQMRNTLKQAGIRLKAASEAAAFWSWIVLSEANPGTPTRPAYPQTFAVVDNGWVDNAWDTQRRRGLSPTLRDVW